MKNSTSKMTMPFLLFGLLTFFSSCRNAEKPLAAPKADQFEIIWKTPITDGPFVLGLNPILYDSLVIMNTEYNLYGDQAPVLFIDTATGTVVDTWSDYIDGTALYVSNSFYTEGDYLVLQTQRSTDCLNLKTRQGQWGLKRRNQLAYVYGHNGFIYTSRQISSKTSVVLRSPINQKNWKTLYSFTANGAMEPFFGAFGFGELPNGDEIVLWQNRTTTPIYRMEVFAYNVTADTLLWRNRDFYTFEVPFSPQVYNGKVYGTLNDGLYCLDLETGETLWTKGYDNLFTHSFLPYQIIYLGHFDNKLIAHGYGSKILYLSPESGSVLRTVDGYPDSHGEGDFSEYQGKLYFTSSYQLVVTDISSGENLASPAKLGELNDIDIYSSITVDPESGKLYFQDGYYLYCVKQPKNL